MSDEHDDLDLNAPEIIPEEGDGELNKDLNPNAPETIPEEGDVDLNDKEGEEYSPSVVLVLLGQLQFEHSGNQDVLSLRIQTPEEMSHSLKEAEKMVKPSSVNALHIIIKSSSVSILFDDTILSTFSEALCPNAEATVHVLGSVDMQVQPDDVDHIRTSLILSGLRLESEGITEGDDGGWILTARKPEAGNECE